MAVTPQILRSWRRPGAVLRGMLAAGQREDRAIMLLMAGCAVIFVAQWPEAARLAELDPEVPLNARLGAALLGWLFVWPILLYGLAALSHLLLRPFGGRGSWYSARLALFWTVLATSPLFLLQGLVKGFIGEGPASTAAQTLVAIGFLAHWALCLREAEFGPKAAA